VVLDPPYIYNPKGTVKSSISDCYLINPTDGLKSNSDVLVFYVDAIREAHRVLVVGGILMVKCQDCIESGRQKWNHIEIKKEAETMGFLAEDLFVLIQPTQPTIRWARQKHARKNHSYLWIFRKKKVE
jgi:hypothetical protein